METNTCRDEILSCVNLIVRRKGQNRFSIDEVVKELQETKTLYKESTIRTHISSKMCKDAPKNHQTTYDDFERIGHGEYRLLTKI